MTDATATSPESTPQRRSLGRILLKLLAVFAVALGVLVIIVAMRPNEMRISRSASIKAGPSAVFPHVNDFHLWDEWSPWAKLDPNAKNSFEGPSSGKDSVFKWSGNDEVGEGSMTIVESTPAERIRIRLDFVRPFEDTSDVEFTFQPEGEETKVTWTMSGKHNFISKAMCLVMNMEKMLGDQFDSGLAKMKDAVEKAASTNAAGETETQK